MAAKTRSEKLKRLVAVQRHMEKMAELELAETTRIRDELARRMDETIEAIGSFNPVHQSLKGQYATQYGRMSGEDGRLTHVQAAQESQILREKAKGDRLEENRQEALAGEEREREDNAVIDLIELNLAMGAPASSKVGGQ